MVVVNSVAVNTSAEGNGGFVFSTGSSRLELVGINVTGASGLLGGMVVSVACLAGNEGYDSSFFELAR